MCLHGRSVEYLTLRFNVTPTFSNPQVLLVDTWVAAELKLYDKLKPKPGQHRVVRGTPHLMVVQSGERELERRFGAVTVEKDEENPVPDGSCPYVSR